MDPPYYTGFGIFTIYYTNTESGLWTFVQGIYLLCPVSVMLKIKYYYWIRKQSPGLVIPVVWPRPMRT